MIKSATSVNLAHIVVDGVTIRLSVHPARRQEIEIALRKQLSDEWFDALQAQEPKACVRLTRALIAPPQFVDMQ
eukprot:5195869-Amphidinium_carterae.1